MNESVAVKNNYGLVIRSLTYRYNSRGLDRLTILGMDGRIYHSTVMDLYTVVNSNVNFAGMKSFLVTASGLTEDLFYANCYAFANGEPQLRKREVMGTIPEPGRYHITDMEYRESYDTEPILYLIAADADNRRHAFVGSSEDMRKILDIRADEDGTIPIILKNDGIMLV